MLESASFICPKYTSIDMMGMSNHHTTQETVVGLYVLEKYVYWSKNVQIVYWGKAKDLDAGLKSHSVRKKPLLKKKHKKDRLQFANTQRDKN